MMRGNISVAVLVLGFSSMLSQIVVLRESVGGFYGNELVAGIVLGVWLLLTGAGSYFGRYLAGVEEKLRLYIILNMTVALLLPVTVYAIKVARTFISTPGELVSFIDVFLYTMPVLAPFCLTTGIQFTLACALPAGEGEKTSHVARIYTLNNIGYLLGGFLFSYILVYLLNPFQDIYIAVILNILSALLLSGYIKARRLQAMAVIMAVAVTAVYHVYDLDEMSTRQQFPGQEIIYHGSSVYGNMVVTSVDSQLNFYENSLPLFSTGNQFTIEEKVHYPMLQHSKPENILLISGGVSGTARELLKYNVTGIDYVELDSQIIEAGLKYTGNLKDPHIKPIIGDARLYVRNTASRYDVIILDLPDPETVQVNRLYTLEFYRDVKKILKPAGIFSLSVSGSDSYMNTETTQLNSAIYTTLHRIFKNIIVIPGDVNYYIASDVNLSYDYPRKLREKNITTNIEYYISGKITDERIGHFKEAISERTDSVNTDFKPISHYHYLSYWMSIFNLKYEHFGLIILAIASVVVYLTKAKPIPTSICITGFSSMVVETGIIVAFQIIYGHVYHQIGVIITAFMLGLSAGAFLSEKIIARREISAKYLAVSDFMIAVYCILLPSALILFNSQETTQLINLSVQLLIPALTALMGILVGVEFMLAVKLHNRKTGDMIDSVALLSGVDLIGACAGALLGAIFLIPVLGVLNTIILAGILNLLSGTYVLYKG